MASPCRFLPRLSDRACESCQALADALRRMGVAASGAHLDAISRGGRIRTGDLLLPNQSCSRTSTPSAYVSRIRPYTRHGRPSACSQRGQKTTLSRRQRKPHTLCHGRHKHTIKLGVGRKRMMTLKNSDNPGTTGVTYKVSAQENAVRSAGTTRVVLSQAFPLRTTGGVPFGQFGL